MAGELEGAEERMAEGTAEVGWERAEGAKDKEEGAAPAAGRVVAWLAAVAAAGLECVGSPQWRRCTQCRKVALCTTTRSRHQPQVQAGREAESGRTPRQCIAKSHICRIVRRPRSHCMQWAEVVMVAEEAVKVEGQMGAGWGEGWEVALVAWQGAGSAVGGVEEAATAEVAVTAAVKAVAEMVVAGEGETAVALEADLGAGWAAEKEEAEAGAMGVGVAEGSRCSSILVCGRGILQAHSDEQRCKDRRPGCQRCT